MFLWLQQELTRSFQKDIGSKLDVMATVFDWVILGTFTGSRLSEYGQSKKKPEEPYALVPHSMAAGQYVGTSLAFIRENFTFYSTRGLNMDQEWAKASP